MREKSGEAIASAPQVGELRTTRPRRERGMGAADIWGPKDKDEEDKKANLHQSDHGEHYYCYYEVSQG